MARVYIPLRGKEKFNFALSKEEILSGDAGG
jgi:hypothetical protein